MDLSVVIPTYNQADLLRECLRSLVDQTLPADRYEIVVVDDGSTDHTPAVLAEFGPRIVAVRLTANRGRSAARNEGVKRATGRLIVFTDSDVTVRRDFLARHVEMHQHDGAPMLSRGPVVLVEHPGDATRARVPRLVGSPAFLDTANAGVAKETLIEAGLFDEGFPGYGWEDFELGSRLKQLGVRRLFSPKAVAFHVQPRGHKDTIGPLLRKEEERAQSAVYFYAKHPGFETKLLIQATAFHHVVYWIQSVFGILTETNIVRVTEWLRSHGMPGLAYVALRGVLNRRYVQILHREIGARRPWGPRGWG